MIIFEKKNLFYGETYNHIVCMVQDHFDTLMIFIKFIFSTVPVLLFLVIYH